MLALLLLVSATLCGVAIATSTRVTLGAWTRVALGTVFAQLLLLFAPFYFAYSFDLGARAAGLCAAALCTALALAALALTRGKLTALVREAAAKLVDRRNVALVVVGAAFMALFAWLHHTHYFRPLANGLHSAGVTWGDLPLHSGLASRFLKADGLPVLEHPLFLGGPLIYPFLPDYLVAVLAALGLGLRGAFIAAGMYGVGSLLLMLHAITRAWLRSERALEPILTWLLFLLAGGFGFVFFVQRLLAGRGPFALLAGTNATYDISPHIAKAGHIGNLFLASRCATHGIPIGLAVVLLLGCALEHRAAARTPLLLAGIAAGALPLVHTHSFLVVAGVLAAQLATARPRITLSQAATCLLPLAVLALPQLWFLSGGGGRSFVRFAPGFLRPAPSGLDWALDLALGMGLGWLLLPWALRSASAHARRMSWPLLLLLPLANLVAFAPASYDNIKFVAWFDVAAAVLLAGWLAPLLRGVGERALLRRAGAALAVLGCTSSGALAVGFELVNDGTVVTNENAELAQLVEAHTPPSAVIATAASYHDPVVMLAGRRTLMATPHMVRLNGIDVRQRALDIARLYAGGPAALALIERFDVYAVVIGPAERSDLPRCNEAFFAQHARARYEAAGRLLYVLDRRSAR